MESSKKIENTLKARLPDYDPGRKDRFSDSALVVNEFHLGETEEEVRAFKQKQKSIRMLKKSSKTGSSFLSPESPGASNTIAPSPAKTLPKTASANSNISATSNEARIVHTQEKLGKIGDLMKKIDQNVVDIHQSKPIVTAKWQPPLPT